MGDLKKVNTKKQSQAIRKIQYMWKFILTKLGKLVFEFEMLLSLGQKFFLTLSKLFHFLKKMLLCKKVRKTWNVKS